MINIKPFLILTCLIVLSCSEDNSPTESGNHPPEIQSVTASPSTVDAGGITNLTCIAIDPDQDELSYSWSSQLGLFPGATSGSSLQWQAPTTNGNYSIVVIVKDGTDTDLDFVNVTVYIDVGWNIDEPPPNPTHGDEWTAYLGIAQIPLEMVYIGPGSFMQGAYTDEQGADSNEYPQHLVTFDYGFWMGKYEVTQSQWEGVMGYNPSYGYGVGADYPVYSVFWDDIMNYTDGFIRQLNDQTTNSTWELPSESEWEYACRAGTTTRYYWGDDMSDTEIDDYAWYNDFSGAKHEVGQKLPNAWGLYDMSGNVSEWCEDCWYDDYNGAPTNGDPWLSLMCSERVLRNNSSGGQASYCRSAFRFYGTISGTSSGDGFRLVLRP